MIGGESEADVKPDGSILTWLALLECFKQQHKGHAHGGSDGHPHSDIVQGCADPGPQPDAGREEEEKAIRLVGFILPHGDHTSRTFARALSFFKYSLKAILPFCVS